MPRRNCWRTVNERVLFFKLSKKLLITKRLQKTYIRELRKEMKIYVSLPITGYDIEERKARAAELKLRFEREGHEAVTPFDLDWEEGKDYAHYMGRDIEALLRCDAAYLDTGWQKSKGCCLEYKAAALYQKLIIFGQ